MRHVPVVVIGAGQAGLAMSYCLSQRGISHIVLERGRIAERWRREQWDSLHLLTENWMTRLPGWCYRGDDPNGFMPASAFIQYLSDYAASYNAPVEAETTVTSVQPTMPGYRVDTDRGVWRTDAVVIATGDCNVPKRPSFSFDMPSWIHQIAPAEYRNPAQLPDGGVLVVGGAATALQLAEELNDAGRKVLLSAGRHSRLPRRYRGRDIWWWLEQSGILNETAAEVTELWRARIQPSFQLIGGPNPHTIDLGMLRDAGVRILGRAIGIDGTILRLRDDLAETTAAAHEALERLLQRIDTVADTTGAPVDKGALRHFTFGQTATSLDLRAEGIRTVIWATGYRRDYSWLQVPILDGAGEICQQDGITPVPGLYTLGLRFQRRRRSHFIDGVGLDAEELAQHINSFLTYTRRAAA